MQGVAPKVCTGEDDMKKAPIFLNSLSFGRRHPKFALMGNFFVKMAGFPAILAVFFSYILFYFPPSGNVKHMSDYDILV